MSSCHYIERSRDGFRKAERNAAGRFEVGNIVFAAFLYIMRHFDFFFVVCGRGLSTALSKMSVPASDHLTSHSPYGFVKHTLQIPLRQSRAL